MVGRRKVTQPLDQTFRADFNELLFISIALKLIEILEDFDGNYDGSISLPIPQIFEPSYRILRPPSFRAVILSTPNLKRVVCVLSSK